MVQRWSIVALIAVATPVSAAERSVPAAETGARQSVGWTVTTLGDRGGWGLIVGLGILALALRRRRPGRVVSN